MTARGVLRVVGADAITFLQGLTTNDMKPLGSGPKAVSAAFLNAQGRVILDAILYSADGETIFIDIAAEKAAELASLLKKYKLRAKVKISDASSELGVWVALGPDVGRWWVQETDKNKTPADDGSFIFQDPRHLDLGIRAIAPLASDGPVQSFLKANPAWLEVPETQCDMFRLSLGVAEGPAEFVSGKSMPLEANLDMFSGVSFNKGCYIGQELTARTHFRGQVRKRLVPFILAGSGETVKGWEVPGELAGAMAYSGESPKPDDVVARDGKQIGKVVSCRGGVGIAMVRLEHMLGKEEELTDLDIGGKKGSVLLPVWWTVVQEQANEQQSVQD
eukprot:CAMPEP_0196735384 /NCGR_PEP_ID=MMETSP1091-20130531/13842_1 /TAXON_ID=302021 /ORGANISM="Rhodomonas sp., Strain CCMP768" /LENGTH=332 /DNA_ID=CAMNT_0042079017 /DNA_START=157 /DNA_END=1155 /DNA_ORIENTATION=+